MPCGAAASGTGAQRASATGPTRGGGGHVRVAGVCAAPSEAQPSGAPPPNRGTTPPAREVGARSRPVTEDNQRPATEDDQRPATEDDHRPAKRPPAPAYSRAQPAPTGACVGVGPAPPAQEAVAEALPTIDDVGAGPDPPDKARRSDPCPGLDPPTGHMGGGLDLPDATMEGGPDPPDGCMLGGGGVDQAAPPPAPLASPRPRLQPPHPPAPPRAA